MHFLTGVASRRVMCAANVPTRLKVLSILLWGSGFEVTQRCEHQPFRSRRLSFPHNRGQIFLKTKLP